MLKDLRFAFRSAVRAPGPTAWIVVTLAIGVGVTTAAFGFFHGVVLKPLQFPDAERLVRLCETPKAGDWPCLVSPPNARDWGAQSESFDAIGVGRLSAFILKDAAGAEKVFGALVTAELFDVLGIEPFIGRVIDRGDVDSQRRVVVLTNRFWKSRYSGDPGVLGRSLTFDGKEYEIIGVLGTDEEVPGLASSEFFVALPYFGEETRMWRGFLAIGRLAPPHDLNAARAEMRTISGRLAAAHPETNQGWEVAILPLREFVVGGARTSLAVFLFAGGLVLLIACANVTSLFLSRSIGRRQEIAVRTALGASKKRIVQLLFVESLVYAIIGGTLGFVLAWTTTEILPAFAPPEIPRVEEVGVSGGVLAFAALVTLSTTVLFGLAPILKMSAPDQTGELRGVQGGLGGRPSRLGNALVVVEVGLATLLVVGGALILQSYVNASTWQPGFNAAGLLVFPVQASESRYLEDHQVARLYQKLLEEVRAIPGVTSAGTASAGPLFGSREASEFSGDEGSLTEPQTIRWYDIDPQYFSTLGLPLIRGRGFTRQDDAASPPVAIVNETLVKRYWPDGNVIGKRIGDSQGDMREVVGVVADVNPAWPDLVAEPEIYWPMLQEPRWATFVVVRGAPELPGLADVIRQRLRQLDSDSSVGQVIRLEDSLKARLVRPRFNTMLVTALALVAVALALGGTYGVVSSMVGLRTHAIGLRMALGARRRTILRWVVARGLVLALAGAGLGVVASLFATRALGTMLYGIEPADPLTYGAAAALVVSIAGLACYLPARRAARISPISVLRG